MRLARTTCLVRLPSPSFSHISTVRGPSLWYLHATLTSIGAFFLQSASPQPPAQLFVADSQPLRVLSLFCHFGLLSCLLNAATSWLHFEPTQLILSQVPLAKTLHAFSPKVSASYRYQPYVASTILLLPLWRTPAAYEPVWKKPRYLDASYIVQKTSRPRCILLALPPSVEERPSIEADIWEP